MASQTIVVQSPLIEGSYNTRAHGEPTPWLIRSASLDSITTAGAKTLTDLGVALIIDLREDNEIPDGTDVAASRRHHIEMLHNPLYRLQAGPPQSGTLEQVYDFLLENRGAELAAAVAAIADASGPVLVHCAAGKDRTGLVVALALEAAGAPRTAIVADYVISASDVHTHRRDAVDAVLARLDLEPAAHAAARRLHLDSPAGALEHALDRLAEHGGAAAYLVRHGLTALQLAHLSARAAS